MDLTKHTLGGRIPYNPKSVCHAGVKIRISIGFPEPLNPKTL